MISFLGQIFGISKCIFLDLRNSINTSSSISDFTSKISGRSASSHVYCLMRKTVMTSSISSAHRDTSCRNTHTIWDHLICVSAIYTLSYFSYFMNISTSHSTISRTFCFSEREVRDNIVSFIRCASSKSRLLARSRISASRIIKRSWLSHRRNLRA